MRSRLSIRSISGSRDGVALIIVLAFIVLLSILIVSFIAFTQANRGATASYAKAIQAQEIAQGGLQDILYDLHEEIVAGSVPDPGGVYTPSGGGPTIYVPSTNLTASPARLGYALNKWAYGTNTIPTTAPATLLPSLVRVSRASQGNPTDFYPTTTFNSTTYNNTSSLPGGTFLLNRASPVSTGTASVNGRYISPARWNKTFLLAANNNYISTPFYNGEPLPLTSYPATPDLPDWVYVTRTGSRVCSNTEVTNKSLLLSRSNPNSSITTLYTPVPPGKQPSASPVVGRYAYVIYDEGALLDVNVAGSPSTLPSAASGTGLIQDTASQVNVLPNQSYIGTSSTKIPVNMTFNGKSYLSFADLSQLPGLGPNVTNAQQTIDNLVNWRSYGSINSVTSGGNSFLGAVFNYASNGFLYFQQDDSPLLSRQDLIRYFTNPNVDSHFNTSTATVSNALPYLGTFSRAISAPSYVPPADASALGGNNGVGNIYAYHSNAEKATVGGVHVSNRDLANVRFSASGSVIHYYDDQSIANTATYNVAAGDPLLQNRFSLAKINWLSQADPTSGNGPSQGSTYGKAIQACFGLVWDYPGGQSSSVANGGNKCWNYLGAVSEGYSLASPPNTIDTLDQVAAQGREPNFFELLKAAILSGSIGLDPGNAAYDNGNNKVDIGGPYNPGGSGGGTANQAGNSGFYSHTFGPATTVSAPAAIADVQIIKIGADIIDQYDTDSYPTAICFRYLTGPGAAFDPASGAPPANPGIYGPVTMVYGDENLPDLERVVSSWCTTKGNGSTGDPTGYTSYADVTAMACFYQPELWNMHQQPTTPLTKVPQNFQIRAYGSALSSWSQNVDKGTNGNPPDPIWIAKGSPSTSGTSPTTNFFQGSGGNAEISDNGTLNFSDSNSGAASSFYAKPTMLSSDQIPGVVASSPQILNMAPTSSGPGYCYPYYSQNHFVAFCTGESTGFFSDQNCEGIADIEPSGANNVTFVLGWLDGGFGSGHFHPYSFITGAFTFDYLVINNGIESYVGGCRPDQLSPTPWYLVDPRTYRFGTTGNIFGGYAGTGNTLFPALNQRELVNSYMPQGPQFFPAPGAGNTTGHPSDWAVNSSVTSSLAGETQTTSFTGEPATPVNYYSDLDAVVRPGDGYYGNASTGDGMPLFLTAGATSTPVGDNMSNSHGRRPVILNRPFRSVGELGYAFRDLPFKTLDFFTPNSADAALLDVFTLMDESKVNSSGTLSSVIAGQVNLSNAPMPVVAAILAGGSKKDLDPNYNMGSETVATPSVLTKLASNICKNLQPATGPNPLVNRAGLVTQLNTLPADGSTPFWGVIQTTKLAITGTPAIVSSFTSSSDQGNKAYLEAPVRALSDVTNTRTWNLLIDIIAQSGQMSPAAQTLNDFVVQEERRYWLHVAIDRYTGKIIDQQLESVYE